MIIKQLIVKRNFSLYNPRISQDWLKAEMEKYK